MSERVRRLYINEHILLGHTHMYEGRCSSSRRCSMVGSSIAQHVSVENYQTVSTLITQATAVPSSQVIVASALPSASTNPRAMKSYFSETTA